MEGKEEISDTDSGIILHSSPDSPTTVMKDVVTHTRAVKLKHQSLEDRLELCLLELRKLCIREAELTGRLSADYPLLPGEKPPQIRKRIGAAFKLDELSIPRGIQDSELNAVEAELLLQLQIYEAARKLCREDHQSKAVKRSRLQQCKREEKKVKQLQESAFQLRLQHGRSSPRPGCIGAPRDQGNSDDSSLSDSLLLDEEEVISQSSQPSVENTPSRGPRESPRPLPGPSPSPGLIPHQPPPATPTLEELQSSFKDTVDLDLPPIEHSPWTESSLDQPYQKIKRKSRSSSCKSSSPVTPVLPPVEACYGDVALPLQKSAHLRLCHTQSSSAPTTPEMHIRRQLSLRVPSSEPPLNLDRDRGRTRVPRRRLADYMATPPDESPVPRGVYGNPAYHSNSEAEDSSSELSAPSYTSSPCREASYDLPRQCQSTYRYQPSSERPHNSHGPQAYPPGPGYYLPPPQQHFSPGFHRDYYDDGMVYPPEVDVARLYHGPPPPCHSGRYEHWYEEAPVHLPRAVRLLPPHARLSRAPSLREYSHHPSRGLPRQVVNEELKSWHQRNQFRPRSLDRQGAVRVRNVPSCESPLSQHQKCHEQAPQRQVFQRAVNIPVQWFKEDESEIASQV